VSHTLLLHHSFRTDLCLRYAPFAIAMAAIFLAIEFAPTFDAQERVAQMYSKVSADEMAGMQALRIATACRLVGWHY
jgi:hypothetical protein